MQIAILGATSQIAKDLICSFSQNDEHQLTLFARRPEVVSEWLAAGGLQGKYQVRSLDQFSTNQSYDALINFIGTGNPEQALAMGVSIFDITLKFDALALDYLRKYPNCLYIFLSSGAAYGANFDRPVDNNSHAIIPINHLRSHDWYSIAKLYAECRHRTLSPFSIIDVRIFNYYSHTQDKNARFLITDIARSIKYKTTLETSRENIIRDYLNPSDFFSLITGILSGDRLNLSIDCYSKEPIDKFTLLSSLKNKFGLNYNIRDGSGINATGMKSFYYSLNRTAEQFGYNPSLSSLDGIIKEIQLFIDKDV